MTNNIITFNFNQNTVRTQAIDGKAWFCLKDACDALGLSNSRKTKTQLTAKGVTDSYTLTNGGKQSVTFINEPNLYRLIFRSNKPQAQAFADWVYEEVLPSIRRTGAYSVADKTVTVAEHTRSLPSGKKEIVLSEKAKQEIGGIVKNCLAAMPKPKEQSRTSVWSDGDLLKTLNLLSERIDNLGRNMTRGFPSAWERSVVRYATDAAQAVGAPAYAQAYVTKAEYDLLCSVRGVAISMR